MGKAKLFMAQGKKSFGEVYEFEVSCRGSTLSLAGAGHFALQPNFLSTIESASNRFHESANYYVSGVHDVVTKKSEVSALI